MKIFSPILGVFYFVYTMKFYINAEETEIKISNYDPEELLLRIFNNTISARQSGFIKFEDQLDQENHQDNIAFEDQTGRPFKFEDQSNEANNNPDNGLVTFQDDNAIGQIDVSRKKRRKRRRRPRYQRPNHGQSLNQVYPGAPLPGLPGIQGQNPYFNPELQRPFYRPHRRPRPSITSEALSAITGALSSIALYDDYQCVPRLLCEAAGGGTLGSSGLLQSVAGIQPLLTLLSAYNGISTSPLFVFGRAVFLGMTSKGNTGTCRYAYPQCPTDPEQLVNYLNNHNGGFFRFFNFPQNQQQQNLQQFYNQLSIGNQNYGVTNTANQVPNPGLYGNGYGYQQNYGTGYPYNQNNFGSNNRIRFKGNDDDDNGFGSNRIGKRIQNRPDQDDDGLDSDPNTKWSFPNDATNDNLDSNDFRQENTLKFPNDKPHTQNNVNQDTIRNPKGFHFPGDQSNRQYVEYYNYPPVNPIFNSNNLKYDNKGYYTGTYTNNKNEEGVQTIYVVRGNGDPNYPEVIKLRPGEKLQ